MPPEERHTFALRHEDKIKDCDALLDFFIHLPEKEQLGFIRKHTSVVRDHRDLIKIIQIFPTRERIKLIEEKCEFVQRCIDEFPGFYNVFVSLGDGNERLNFLKKSAWK